MKAKSGRKCQYTKVTLLQNLTRSTSIALFANPYSVTESSAPNLYFLLI